MDIRGVISLYKNNNKDTKKNLDRIIIVLYDTNIDFYLLFIV